MIDALVQELKLLSLLLFLLNQSFLLRLRPANFFRTGYAYFRDTLCALTCISMIISTRKLKQIINGVAVREIVYQTSPRKLIDLV